MNTSIIMTSYNYQDYISQAIESVINQTLNDWELIVVDDGSSDKSLDIIKKYCQKDERIKLLTHPNHSNLGIKKSLLLGINSAKYDWIAILESDDYWSANYLEEKAKMVKKYPQCNFIYNDIECFGDEKRIKAFAPYLEKLQKIWQSNEFMDVFDEFATDNIVPTFSCVMCKKSEFLKCNTNTPSAPVIDYWLWWQIAENNKFCFINKKLTHWRLHPKSYLSKEAKTLKHHVQRSLFLPKLTKIFKRKPNFPPLYDLEQYPAISVPWYIYKYIMRKRPQFIKDLFKTR